MRFKSISHDQQPTPRRILDQPTARVLGGAFCGAVVGLWLAAFFMDSDPELTGGPRWSLLTIPAAGAVLFALVALVFGNYNIRGLLKAVLGGILIGIVIGGILLPPIVGAWRSGEFKGYKRGVRSAIFIGVPAGAATGLIIGLIVGLRKRARDRSVG